MSIDAMRRNYDAGELTEQQAGDDPIALFRRWFAEAKDANAGEWYETNAMTLATVDESGTPDARIVLLKSIEDEGVVFYTNYTSAKAKQIEGQPTVALVFHWAWLERQVRIVGRASKIDRKTSEQYFATRPRGSQLGAWVSEQSEPTTREALAERLAELEKQFDGRDVPCPPQWGGYFVEAKRFEFWQGRPNRLHDRLVYEKGEGGWTRVRLSP
jgi:pyridoxamine 5'-phosphate oxidase